MPAFLSWILELVGAAKPKLLSTTVSADRQSIVSTKNTAIVRAKNIAHSENRPRYYIVGDQCVRIPRAINLYSLCGVLSLLRFKLLFVFLFRFQLIQLILRKWFSINRHLDERFYCRFKRHPFAFFLF